MEKIKDVHLGMHILEIEITNRCNLNCLHCYNRGEKECELPINTIYDITSFATDNEVSKLVISGGEACLHSDFDSLCKNFLKTETSFKKVVQSNGSISKVDIGLLRAFDIVHLSFELDETNIRTTKQNNIIDTALWLKKNGIYAYFFATVHSGNIGKVDKIIDIANKVGIDIAFNMYVNLNDNSDLAVNKCDVRAMTELLHKRYEEGKILKYSSPLVAVVANRKSVEFCGIKGGCTAGVAACAIKSNGDVIPCPFLRINAGNIFHENLRNIWLNSKLFNILRDRRNYEGQCETCECLSYCGGCRSRALEATGNIIGEDPLCFKL